MKKILLLLISISILYPQDPLLSQPYYFVQETGPNTIKIGHSTNPSNTTGIVILGIKDYSNADSWKNDKVILFPLKHTAMYYDLYNVNKKATIRVSVVFGTPNVANVNRVSSNGLTNTRTSSNSDIYEDIENYTDIATIQSMDPCIYVIGLVLYAILLLWE
jgi:hypothetical protein|tara:strand:+ start:189 stop:671 length:483 start_codon:yes stop_codon:yes gene_type:complete